jgi:hypothetical protein
VKGKHEKTRSDVVVRHKPMQQKKTIMAEDGAPDSPSTIGHLKNCAKGILNSRGRRIFF